MEGRLVGFGAPTLARWILRRNLVVRQTAQDSYPFEVVRLLYASRVASVRSFGRNPSALLYAAAELSQNGHQT